MWHEVTRGDAIEQLRCFEPNAFDLVLTDIPYGEVNRSSGGLRNLDKGDADVLTFDLDVFVDECVRVCRGSFYIFCGIEQVSPLARAFTRHGLTIRHGIWRKTNPSPMNGTRLWLSGTENCIFARKPKAVFNERCQAAVWDCPTVKSRRHPTEKPVRLFQRLIEASTNPGDWVLDPCAGSGTTAEACIRSGRNSWSIEKNPEYTIVIRERIAVTLATQAIKEANTK